MKQYILVNNTLRSIKEGADVEKTIFNLQSKGLTVVKVKKPPSFKTMQKWMMDGVAKAVDGCRVEPDGTCSHGHQSWLLVLGVV